MTCERREALLWNKILETMWHQWGSVSEWHFGHVGIQESGRLSVHGDSVWQQLRSIDECELTSVVTVRSKAPWAPFSRSVLEKVEYGGDQAHPLNKDLLSPRSEAGLSGAGGQGHKDESGFCVSGRRHRVRWVWGPFFTFRNRKLPALEI